MGRFCSVVDCRAHTDAIGQCTPVTGWKWAPEGWWVSCLSSFVVAAVADRFWAGVAVAVSGEARGSCWNKQSKLQSASTGARVYGNAAHTEEGDGILEGGISARPSVVMVQADGCGLGVAGRGARATSRRRALATALALTLVDLVPSCCQVHGRQLDGELEIRSLKRSWTI